LQGKDAAKPQQDQKKQAKAGASKRALTEAKTPQLRTSKRKRTADQPMVRIGAFQMDRTTAAYPSMLMSSKCRSQTRFSADSLA